MWEAQLLPYSSSTSLDKTLLRFLTSCLFSPLQSAFKLGTTLKNNSHRTFSNKLKHSLTLIEQLEIFR